MYSRTGRTPVRPGDALSVRTEVIATTPFRSRPNLGTLKCRLEVRNQRGELVMTEVVNVLYARRPPATGGAA